MDSAMDKSIYSTVRLLVVSFRGRVGAIDCNLFTPQSGEGSMSQAHQTNMYIIATVTHVPQFAWILSLFNFVRTYGLH